MRVLLWAAVFGAAVTGSALAGQPPHAMMAANDAGWSAPSQKERVLYICESDAATRRAFAREFGAVEFVRADEVSRDETAWNAPKCITRSESARLRAQLAGGK